MYASGVLRAVATGIGEAVPSAGSPESLELLIFRAASAALANAGVSRADLDGVVIAASDQVDGRAISSMLTAGPAGAYLSEEINLASSPGHALSMGYMQILSGTHRRLLVSSWGKASESAESSTQPAERLSAEPFFDRDAGVTALAAAALQAQAHRMRSDRAAEAAAAIASRNHGRAEGGEPRVTREDVTRSALVAHPLRRLEVPVETDGAFSILLERDDRRPEGAVLLAGVGWCTDSGSLAGRDLARLPHLRRASADALSRAGVAAADVAVWQLHDYTPDAEILAYEAVGLADDDEGVRFVLDGEAEQLMINPAGGSVAGEAPFGGPLRKVLDAVRAVRSGAAATAAAQLSSGFAGQFQSVFVVRGEA